MAKRRHRTLRSVAWSLILLLFIAGCFVACQERQTIRDYFDARDFEPSAEIQQVIDNIDLTPVGTRVFLATHPQMQQGNVFNDRCRAADSGGHGHLLGCYASGNIHLFHVTDERLSSVIEVTAVHELLHAAYSRLSHSERDTLASRLTGYYEERIVTDPDLEERMQVYSHLSASRFANELHSVLATEVPDLPDWLERHYAQWLTDRATITDFYASYREVFESVQEEAAQLKAELDAMHESVEHDTQSYTSAVEAFNTDWKQFVARNEAYGFSGNPEEFNRLKREFDGRRGQLDAWKVAIESNISDYEALRTQLENLGELSEELNSQIDSTLPIVP